MYEAGDAWPINASNANVMVDNITHTVKSHKWVSTWWDTNLKRGRGFDYRSKARESQSEVGQKLKDYWENRGSKWA